MRTQHSVRLLAVMLMATMLFAGHPAMAASDSGHSRNPIVWVGAVLTNIVYMPAKLVYSIVGGVTGALAYPVTVGNAEVSQSIWRTACLGTYVVTPSMLEEKETIRFNGP